MNLYFEKIILHNFASYTHIEVDLTSRGFCLVSGRNLFKKDNSYSNGSGKSMIWNGICFTLTGETIKGIKAGLKNNLVDEEDCYTELHFRDDADRYKITRIIAPKSDLHIIKNDEDISGKGIRESEKKLGEVLPNLNKELITAIILFGQGMPNAFSKLSPSGRKDLLEKLTNSEFMIEAIKERAANVSLELNTRLRQDEDNILVKTTQKNAEITNITNYQNKLDTMVKPDFEANLKAATEQFNKISGELEAKAKEQEAVNTKLNAVTDSVQKVLVDKNNELLSLQTTYNNSLSGGLKKKAEIEAAIKATTAEINRIRNIKEFCPTCGQKLIGVEKPSTKQLESDLVESQDALKKINAEFERLANVYNTTLAEITERYKDALATQQADKALLAKQVGLINSEILNLATQKNTLKNTIDAIKLEASTWDTNVAKLNQALTEAKTNRDKLETLIAELTTEKQTTSDRVAVLKKIDSIIKRDLRGHLLTNIINFINKKSKEFCNIVFGTSEIEVYLDGNALDITYCGKMFDNLSGGEQMRVDLILQLAIRDMLKSYLSLQSNVIVLDEVTDFLDKQSCKAVMTLIEKELNSVESVFIVSHHAETLDIPIDTELKI